MVMITDKPEHDPVMDMPLVDAYMRWAMESVKKVIGENGLNLILKEAGLERFVDSPPSGEMIVTTVTFGDYSKFNAALINHFQRPGKNMVMRIGRESAQTAVSFQRNLFNLGVLTAAKMLPDSVQIKMGLSALMAGFRTLTHEKSRQEFKASVEERGEHYAVIVETCALCAGKQSDSCIGWLWEAVVEESAEQTWGKFFDVTEVECRAKGNPAGVWLVSKKAGEEIHS